jgi:hypothetical protein
MSCSSPFEYGATGEVDLYSQPVNVGYSGSLSIPGYSIPGMKICDWVWVPNSWECKCLGGCVCGKTWHKKWCSCCTKACLPNGGKYETTSCWTTPSASVFPDLTFDFTMTVPMTFVIGVGETITLEGPTIPYITNSINITKFDCSVKVNGQPFVLTVPAQITITQTNGEFSATYQLATLNETYTADGFAYNLNFTFNLLACLTPEPPVGWLNIQVIVDMDVDYADNIAGAVCSLSAAAVCPIISVEDEGPDG